MGMTGRISTPTHIPKLVEVRDTTTYPPSHTYLRFIVENRHGDDGNDAPGIVAEACFSDPRKFGSILLRETMEDEFDILAPDAWATLRSSSLSSSLVGDKKEGDMEGTDDDVLHQLKEKLANQSMGIKAQLLDQKRIVSGVGNWVADEVLYQCQLHPDQNYLTYEQAHRLMECLAHVLETAVDCLTTKREEFPSDWLFHYRWSKGKSATPTKGKKKGRKEDEGSDVVEDYVDIGKDAKGRSIAFVTSGGRTSAIVPAIQKKKSQKQSSSSSSSSTKSEAVLTEMKAPTKHSTSAKATLSHAVGTDTTKDTSLLSDKNSLKKEKRSPALDTSRNSRQPKKPRTTNKRKEDNDFFASDSTSEPKNNKEDGKARPVRARRSARLLSSTS